MLTIQHIQEDLSRAYIQAVAAKAGVNLSLGTQAHDYGVDGTFHQVEAIPRVDAEGKPYMRRRNSGFNLEFQNEWQSFRTRQSRDLELTTAQHTYDRPGRYTVAVKVIDIFGNDTMSLVPVNVG